MPSGNNSALLRVWRCWMRFGKRWKNPTNIPQSVIGCLELLQTGSGAPAGDVTSDLAHQLLAPRAVRIYPSLLGFIPLLPALPEPPGALGKGGSSRTIPAPGVSQVRRNFSCHQEDPTRLWWGNFPSWMWFRDKSGRIYLGSKHRDNGIYG